MTLKSHAANCSQRQGVECNCGAFEHNERVYAGDAMTERGRHTKWMYELHLPKGSADGVWQVLDAEQVIANVDPNDAYTDEAENFARLIAAAPGLLEALRALSSTIDETVCNCESRGWYGAGHDTMCPLTYLADADTAIKAAEGGE